jgi:hypothetical protein
MAQMTVRDHIGYPMDLQHQTGRNHAWVGSLRSAVVDDCDGALFSDRCRERFETRRRLNSTHPGISKGEWL